MLKIRKILAIVLTSVLFITMLVGCGSQDAKNSSLDTLTVATVAEPRGLDFALVNDNESANITSNIYEGLLRFSRDSTDLEPSLAKSWDISVDGLSYTFTLREGVKFHDRTDFNAEAVKFNIDRQLGGNATSDMSYAETVYGNVKNVEVIDNYTVKINLKTICTPFLRNLAMCMGAPMASPKALKDNNNSLNENPVGTGAYKFVRWDKGQNVILIRNDEYWGDKANIKNLIFKVIADSSARAVALENGEADIVAVDTNIADQIKNSGNTLLTNEGMNIFYTGFNFASKNVEKLEVRKAIVQAINVPEMTESLTKGYATPATSILPKFMDGYDSSIKQYSYDPESSKAAIASLGVNNIHFITHTGPRGQETAEAIQGYLSKVGINCTIDAYDWTTYNSKIKNGDYDMCYYGWIGDNGDPDNFLSLLSVSDPTLNVSRYNNSVYNDGIKKGLSMPIGADRNKVYTDLEKLQASDIVWLPLWHTNQLAACRTNISNYKVHMTGVSDFKYVTKK